MTEKSYFLIILLRFIIIYALQVIYIYIICKVKILHNGLHISFQLHIQ